MKSNLPLFSISILFLILSCQGNDDLKNQKFTAINPLSYTDVVFISSKDTVLVSTYSGRISKRIKEHDKEEVIIQLNDEIYSIQFSKKQNAVIASTLSSGILFIDVSNGVIKKQLEIKKHSWINTLFLSHDEAYLVGFDTKGNNHIWDLNNDYNELDFTKELPNSYIRFVDKSGDLYFQTTDKYLKWDINSGKVEKEFKINGRLVDITDQGDLLSLNYNEFEAFSPKADSVVFKRKHPYYIYKLQNGDTVHYSHQLKLTDALFSFDKIYTSGLDKSIRVWNKKNGTLMDEWYLHDATISALDITHNYEQIVSVDLKGGIIFWDLK